MLQCVNKVFYFLILIPIIISAAPSIEFENTSVDFGSITEGKLDSLNAKFIFRNSGDTLLKITRVNPGCGCVTVRYDSLIGPGESGSIDIKLNIKGFSSGPVSKKITVISNSGTDSAIGLYIRVLISSPVELSENYIKLDSSHLEKPFTLTLASSKKDLKVTSVIFTANKNTKDSLITKSPSFPIKHNFTMCDAVKGDSVYDYRLDLFQKTVVNKTIYGNFTISTNHPDKPSIKLHGSVYH